MGTAVLDLTTIVLAEDGRHVTLGRLTKPSVPEIERSASGLAAQGLGGWLCRLEGDYYGRSPPNLMPIQVLGEPARSVGEAIDSFLDLRRKTLFQ